MIDTLLYASLALLGLGCALKLLNWVSDELDAQDPAYRAGHMMDSIYDETTGREK